MCIRDSDNLSVADCPFRSDWTTRLEVAKGRLDRGEVGSADLDEAYRRIDFGILVASLDRSNPDDPDDLVVIHGDPSLPNLILGASGLSGWVDLGRVGVGSRWCDLMIVASTCLLYTSDAADERSSVDLGGRRIIKKTRGTRRHAGSQQ